MVLRNSFSKEYVAYVNSEMSRVSLLSMMDEDYHRVEGVLDHDDAMDMVLQSEYIISLMSAYL